MKYWLNIPCKDLSREWLLDEHQSIHAYFGGMLKNPDKWVKHKLIGPMDALAMYLRHEEEVAEMIHRGYNHVTPIAEADMQKVQNYRVAVLGLSVGEMYSKVNDIVVVEEMKLLQQAYLKNRGVQIGVINMLPHLNSGFKNEINKGEF